MDIKSFLRPPIMNETKKIIVSKDFIGTDGKPVEFKIRKIDQETNDKLLRRAQKQVKQNGQMVTITDNEKFGCLLITTCVIEPDFKNSEICEYYETMDPLDVPRRMLTSGEYARLMMEINSFNGFDAITDEAIGETAKN